MQKHEKKEHEKSKFSKNVSCDLVQALITPVVVDDLLGYWILDTKEISVKLNKDIVVNAKFMN